MRCSDIEPLLLAERDGALTLEQRAVLDGHVVGCQGCRQTRVVLAEAAQSWRQTATSLVVPNAASEWRVLRRHLHETPAPVSPFQRWKPALAWAGLPLATAAAIAFLIFSPRSGPGPETTSNAFATSETMARADYVETGDATASTLVYVDQESGWLIVWATEAETPQST